MNKFDKIDVVKVISIAGTVLGIAASLCGAWANKRIMDNTIDEKVKAALNNQN